MNKNSRVRSWVDVARLIQWAFGIVLAIFTVAQVMPLVSHSKQWVLLIFLLLFVASSLTVWMWDIAAIATKRRSN
jgi:uncharacterized membrane protein